LGITAQKNLKVGKWRIRSPIPVINYLVLLIEPWLLNQKKSVYSCIPLLVIFVVTGL